MNPGPMTWAAAAAGRPSSRAPVRAHRVALLCFISWSFSCEVGGEGRVPFPPVPWLLREVDDGQPLDDARSGRGFDAVEVHAARHDLVVPVAHVPVLGSAVAIGLVVQEPDQHAAGGVDPDGA